jgi:hypothetical protein
MNQIKKYLQITMLAVCLFGTSCTDDFDEINSNPELTTQVPASQLVVGLLDYMKLGGQEGMSEPYLFTKYMSWVENMKSIQYNEIGEYGFGVYTSLKNIEKLYGYSSAATDDTYKGLGLFLKATRLFDLSLNVGDIPYGESLQGETTGLLKPKYDTQKEIAQQVIADLDAAYEHFNKATVALAGDITDLKGDVNKWKRVVNLAELRVLINLSKKEADTDLNIKAKFAEVAARALLQSNADNYSLTFADTPSQYHPIYDGGRSGGWYVSTRCILSDFLIDLLKQCDDYRLFYYAAPAETQITAGKTADDYDAYVGANPTMQYGDLAPILSSGAASMINRRYTTSKIAEPWARYGYAQQCFILAEGALRGWLPGKTAAEYYKLGIRAGLEFTQNATTVSNTQGLVGRQIDEAYIAAHLNAAAVQLTGNVEQDLKKIMEQKYIASFMQYTGEPYFDYRRTGYPLLPINPATNMNSQTDRFPVRYRYPSKEKTTNLDNYNEAIQRQFGGDDNVNQLMWILK